MYPLCVEGMYWHTHTKGISFISDSRLQPHLYLSQQGSRQFNCYLPIFMLHMLFLLHNLCNPMQTFLYSVKENLVLLCFGYRKRRMLSVLLKMACYLLLVPAVFWKVPPTPCRGPQQAEEIERNHMKFKKKCKVLHPGKEQPHASVYAGEHPSGKGPGSRGGCYVEHEPAVYPCCSEG